MTLSWDTAFRSFGGKVEAWTPIADLSRMVDEKEAALRRAELMAKEINHRVMNSLQLVSGFLNMQSRGVGSSEAAEQLELASHRVTAISQVHRHIYQSDGVDKVNCKGTLNASAQNFPVRCGQQRVMPLQSSVSD
jgi:two-component sensor histidine kinase